MCVLSCRNVMQSFVVEQKRPRHCWRIDLIIYSTQVRICIINDRFKKSCQLCIFAAASHVFSPPGSQSVARCILQAAAVHLTPVTLELGGKCPCLIYGRLDMKAAAKRLVWAKFFNAGQSCVAPDYVLCTAETRDMLLPYIKETLKSFYGSEPQQSQDMGRIVTDRHWDRLVELLKKSEGKIVIGGESEKKTKYIGK